MLHEALESIRAYARVVQDNLKVKAKKETKNLVLRWLLQIIVLFYGVASHYTHLSFTLALILILRSLVATSNKNTVFICRLSYS